MLARPMRGSLVIVLLVALVVAALAMQWLGVFADSGMPSPLPGDSLPGESPRSALTAPAGSLPTDALGTGIVATRTVLNSAPNTNLADEPTAVLRVLEHGTDRAIAGAPIRRVQDGSDLAFTDERGFAAVALLEPEQLAVVVDGFLLRMVPTRLGSTEAEPQLVPLVRDEWSIVRRFEFATTDGTPIDEAFVRLRPRNVPKTPPPVPAGDAIRQRAWTEHTMLAACPVCSDVPVQLGTWAEERVHRLKNGTDVRFIAPGEFTVEVATTSGWVAHKDLRIEANPRANAPPIRIALEAGAFVQGHVVGIVAGAPLADTKLTLQGGEPLGLMATTSADGAFRFGPLLAGRVTLHVRHGDHEPLAFGPIEVPGSDVRIPLQPLPKTTLRGRVRARPHLQPIAGATVKWSPSGSAPVIAITDKTGLFTLRATGTADARLAVQAIGYLAYAELITPGAPFADLDLWPATTAERLSQGLTALLEGIVVDASGQPVVHASVHWHPAQAAAALGVPGRRVLEGASLDLPLVARTGNDGAFRLETNAFGAGRLTLAGQTAGLDTTASAGQTKNGLRLQQ